MDTRQELIKKIEDKESQLEKAQRESNAWNNGKYNNSSNASMSKVLVESLRKDIQKLREQLESL